jgi:hypothetical protein
MKRGFELRFAISTIFVIFAISVVQLGIMRPLALCLIALIVVTSSSAHAAQSEWIRRGTDGTVLYKTTPAGDRIMDFSYAGYRGGGVAIPDVAVKREVKPSGGADDAPVIQAAIDEVANLPPDADGFRGAVLLAPGIYPCAATINIATSGVVLRGSAAKGKNTSTIKLIGKPHLAISARLGGRRGGGDSTTDTKTLAETKIADAYVPSGAMSFSVVDASQIKPGDAIVIRRPVTAAWIEFMQMHDLVRNGKPQTWIKPGATITIERNVAAIEGRTITLDVPLSDSFDAKYLNPPGTAVVKLASPPARLANVGLEHFRIECPPQAFNHTEDHFSAVRLSGQDCWMRDLNADETMDSIAIGGRRISVLDVHVHRTAEHQGASKPAEFAPNGSQVLLDRCSVTADNVWHVATGGGLSGPIVVLNCTFTGRGKSESHQRWSTGLLYDNCRAIGGGFEMRNRGSMGSGHGWSMGWGVVWNCTAESFLIQNPPGVINWLIGSVGEIRQAPRPFGEGPMLPGGTVHSHDQPVTPASLYLSQLQARLGDQAIRNIGYTSDVPTGR